jgi:hypothetical protein
MIELLALAHEWSCEAELARFRLLISTLNARPTLSP